MAQYLQKTIILHPFGVQIDLKPSLYGLALSAFRLESQACGNLNVLGRSSKGVNRGPSTIGIQLLQGYYKGFLRSLRINSRVKELGC